MLVTIYGEPIPQLRPRITTVNGYARSYDPTKSRDYKDYIRLAMAGKCYMMLGAVVFKMDIYLSIPKSFSKKKTLLAIEKQLLPTSRPDIDNVEKTVFDALKSVAWKDDSQVVETHIRKFYGEQPRIELEITERS